MQDQCGAKSGAILKAEGARHARHAQARNDRSLLSAIKVPQLGVKDTTYSLLPAPCISTPA
jgi:hypothetical protein